MSLRVRVSEQRAVDLISAAGVGVIMTTLATPLKERDPGLADGTYQAVLSQILTDPPERGDSGPMATVVGMRALAPRLDMLSGPERELLVEWLDRAIADL